MCRSWQVFPLVELVLTAVVGADRWPVVAGGAVVVIEHVRRGLGAGRGYRRGVRLSAYREAASGSGGSAGRGGPGSGWGAQGSRGGDPGSGDPGRTTPGFDQYRVGAAGRGLL